MFLQHNKNTKLIQNELEPEISFFHYLLVVSKKLSIDIKTFRNIFIDQVIDSSTLIERNICFKLSSSCNLMSIRKQSCRMLSILLVWDSNCNASSVLSASTTVHTTMIDLFSVYWPQNLNGQPGT